MADIIIVDDQDSIRDTLKSAFSDLGHTVNTFATGTQALAAFQEKPADLVISDVRMPEMDGFKLLQAIKNIDPSVKFIMMTAYSSIDDAVAAMKLGALDYISKPFDLKEIETKVKKLFTTSTTPPLKASQSILERYDGHPSRNENMVSVYEIAKKASQNKSNVLIRGDSGTGKELIAKAIHFNGREADGKPFVKVNCAALAEGILESELFGHERGAFTGAMGQRKGKFEIADNGTLFLDEIGDIPLNTQVKLLRVLQEREFERVGGNETISVTVRIITATNKNLEEMISNGTFREDLFYRLNVIPIYLPPLRERPEDIDMLMDHFLARLNARIGRSRNFSAGARARLHAYHWPGNVRQLENLVELLLNNGSLVPAPGSCAARPPTPGWSRCSPRGCR